MRLLADQDVHFMTTQMLRELGHDVVTVRELEMHGASDEAILRRAVENRRLLFTRDKGFGALRSSLGLLLDKPRFQPDQPTRPDRLDRPNEPDRPDEPDRPNRPNRR